VSSDYEDPGDQLDAGKRARRGKAKHSDDVPDLFGSPSPVRIDTRETAAAALARVSPEVSRLQELVFGCFERYGEMTDEKLEGLPELASLGPSTIRTRRSELIDLSKLEAVGKTVNARGNPVTIFAVAKPRKPLDEAFTEYADAVAAELPAARESKPPMYFDVEPGTAPARCRYCHRVIYWIKTPQTGSPAPIDCDAEGCSRPDTLRVVEPRAGRGVNHFVTCPLRDQARRDAKAKKAGLR
jgi:hypothetical protein